MNRLRTYACFVRFSHSVFALPFALTGALLALHRTGDVGARDVALAGAAGSSSRWSRRAARRWGSTGWSTRTYDALNPRTAMREIPRGAMTRARSASSSSSSSSLVFVFAAWQLGPICFALSPVALAIVFWYSLAKRVTSYTQLFLGLAMAVAPVGGWLAAGGRGGVGAVAARRWRSAPGSAASTCSTRARISTSIARTGCARFRCASACARSLVISRAHARRHRRVPRWRSAPVADLGLDLPRRRRSASRVLLVYEQSLVSEHDLSQVKRAFDLNGYVGILYFVTTAAAIYVR